LEEKKYHVINVCQVQLFRKSTQVQYANTYIYWQQDVAKPQGCFYFSNGISHSLSHSHNFYLPLLRIYNKNKKNSANINNIECICSLATHSSILKCFRINMEILPWGEMSLEIFCKLTYAAMTRMWMPQSSTQGNVFNDHFNRSKST
jgi:hypothetical protein